MKMQFKLFNYQFKSHFGYLLLLLVCVTTFIKLGLWQYHKAQHKQRIEDAYHASTKKQTKQLIDYIAEPETIKFQKVQVAGHYEPRYQFLVDNQVERGRGGFHVITPFKIKGKTQYVLINRGWIQGLDNHQAVPQFDTPLEEMLVEGMVWVPTNKIFTLEKKETASTEGGWQPVWQHLDMKKFQSLAPIQTLDVIVKLDPAQKKSGFVRNWQLPPSKIATNLGYAYQWFGFAVAAVFIFLYQSISKTDR